MCTGKEAKEEHDVVMSYSLMLQSQPFIKLSVFTNKATFVVKTFYRHFGITHFGIRHSGIRHFGIRHSGIRHFGIRHSGTFPQACPPFE